MSMAAILKDYPDSLRKKVGTALMIAMVLVTFSILAKKCGGENDSTHNSFLTGARMIPPPVLVSDTTKPKVDSATLWNMYLDSVWQHTSIFQFNNFLRENATVKQYEEGKYQDFLTSFIRYQYQLWQSKKPTK